MSVRNIFEFLKILLAAVHIFCVDFFEVIIFMSVVFFRCGTLRSQWNFAFSTKDINVSCWMKFAFLHRKLMLAVSVRDNIMGFGVWIFHMFVSALFTKWPVTSVAVKLTILLTVFSTTNLVVLHSSLFIRSLSHL